jgi:hypothetical protein
LGAMLHACVDMPLPGQKDMATHDPFANSA